jgi:hypothetical protein
MVIWRTILGRDSGLEDRITPSGPSLAGMGVVAATNAIAEPEYDIEELSTDVDEIPGEPDEQPVPAVRTPYAWDTTPILGDPAQNKPWANSIRLKVTVTVSEYDANGNWTGNKREISVTTTVVRRGAGAGLRPKHLDELITAELVKLGVNAQDTAGDGMRTDGHYQDGTWAGYVTGISLTAYSVRDIEGNLVPTPSRYLPTVSPE